MRVRIIKKINSPVNDVKYNIGQVIRVVEIDEISNKCYGRYFKLGNETILDWIPKDSVRPAPDGDEELQWKSDMIEWGEISCPFRNNEYVMTYYPNGCRPYDTVTNPFIDDDGYIYFYKYDHDEGGWNEDINGLCDAEEYENIEEVLFY